MYSISFVALSLSLLLLLYSPSFRIYICKHGYDVTCKNKKKKSNMHTTWKPWLSAIVCMHIETNKHIHTSDVFISKKKFSLLKEKILHFLSSFIEQIIDLKNFSRKLQHFLLFVAYMTERASLAVQNLPMIDIEERGGGAVKHRQTDRIRRTQVLCL